MISKESKIGVTSRTFCKSDHLKKNLLKSFSKVKFNKEGIHFNDDDLINFLTGCEAAIVSGENLSENILNNLPDLKVISKFGVGLDNFDLDFMKKKGIELIYNPGLNASAVAELTLSYLILLLREANSLNRELISGTWSKARHPKELSESSIGIIGFGQIGKKLVEFLSIHGPDIIIFDPFLKEDQNLSSKLELTSDLNFLLQSSDAVTIHIPLNESTRNYLGKYELGLMKKGSVLLNLSRGGLISEDELYNSLSNNHLGAAAFDVFEQEPVINKKLLSLPNFFCTPHIAGTSTKSTNALGASAIQGLIKHIK